MALVFNVNVDTEMVIKLSLEDYSIPIDSGITLTELQQYITDALKQAAYEKLVAGDCEVVEVKIVGEPDIRVDGELDMPET